MSEQKCTERAEDLSAGNLLTFSCRGVRVENRGRTNIITKFWRSWVVSYPIPSSAACQPQQGEQLSGEWLSHGAWSSEHRCSSSPCQLASHSCVHTAVPLGFSILQAHIRCTAPHVPLHHYKGIWGHLSPDLSAPYTSCQSPICSREFSALHSLFKHIACYWLPLLLTRHVIPQPGLGMVFCLPDSATSSC